MDLNTVVKRQVFFSLEALESLIEQVKRYFATVDSTVLLKASAVYPRTTNLDVVLGQIRYLQYHIGHCECILRESGVTDLEWTDYYGD